MDYSVVDVETGEVKAQVNDEYLAYDIAFMIKEKEGTNIWVFGGNNGKSNS